MNGKGREMTKLPDIMGMIAPLAKQLIGWTVAFLAPIHTVMLAVGALILFDLITGIWASKKAGRPITSFGIRRTVTKAFAYQMSLITSMIMENYFLPEIPVIRIIAGLIAVTEFKSFLENVTDITGIDFWKAILDKIQGTKLPGTPDSEQDAPQTAMDQMMGEVKNDIKMEESQMTSSHLDEPKKERKTKVKTKTKKSKKPVKKTRK